MTIESPRKNVITFLRRLAALQMILGILGCCLAIAMGYLLDRSMGHALAGLSNLNQTVSRQIELTIQTVDGQQDVLASVAKTLEAARNSIASIEHAIDRSFAASESVLGVVTTITKVADNVLRDVGQLANFQTTLVGKTFCLPESVKGTIIGWGSWMNGIQTSLETTNSSFIKFHEQLLKGTGTSLDDSIAKVSKDLETLHDRQIPELETNLLAARADVEEIDRGLRTSRWAIIIVTGITGVLSLLFLVNGLSFWLLLSDRGRVGADSNAKIVCDASVIL